MKKINYTIIWVSGIFLLLIVILAMIMTYKIKYEDSIYYKYLYFYSCNDDVCATTKDNDIKDKSLIYSVYKYQKNKPTFSKIGDNYVEIKDNNTTVLYDYVLGKNITKNYTKYLKINDKDLFITSNDKNKYGIIDISGKPKVSLIYDNIKESYNLNMIVASTNQKYGIINMEDATTILDFTYDDLYIYDDVIIAITNNSLDIINKDKKSFITTKIEINNINDVSINREDNIINIKVSKNNEFSEYKFDIDTKKLL